MDTGNQIYIASVCLLAGYASGLIYEITSFFRLIFGCKEGKNKILGAVLDVIFFIAFAFWVIFIAKTFQFPNFRGYMWIVCLLGWLLYLKSLHFIVDFFENVCYNGIKKAVKKRKMSKNSTLEEEK